MTINSQEYWDSRFSSDYWEKEGGRSQTRLFAETQSKYLDIPSGFNGTILDFGCGLGDALPVYSRNYPEAKLIGVDFSASAIEKCKSKYGVIASFFSCSYQDCPPADVIITSNVLEHLEDDQEAAKTLLSKCKDLYIVVPYREQHLIDEHLRGYDKHSFDNLAPCKAIVFASRGWSQFGLKNRWWQFHIKNLMRPLFGKPIQHRRMQILYHCINLNLVNTFS